MHIKRLAQEEEEEEKEERQRLIEKGELWEAIPMSELEKELGNISWLWPEWIPQGFVTSICAPGESGKSLFALSLVKTILTNGNWPDGQPAGLGNAEKVIWVEAEAGQVMLKQRVKELQMPSDRLFLPAIKGDKFGQPDLSLTTHQRGLWRMVEEVQPKLVIIDSLGQAQTRSENQKREIQQVMTFLQHLARDNNTTVLIIHHFNKPQQFQIAAAFRVRGSTLIANACKSIIGIEHKGESRTRKVYHIKSNLSAYQPPLAMTIGGAEHFVEFSPWTEELQEEPETDTERCATWLQDCLAEHGAQRPKTLIEWAQESEGFSRATVYRAKDLAQNIVSEGAGPSCRWELRQTMIASP
jgi:RecA-family ATPase